MITKKETNTDCQYKFLIDCINNYNHRGYPEETCDDTWTMTTTRLVVEMNWHVTAPDYHRYLTIFPKSPLDDSENINLFKNTLKFVLPSTRRQSHILGQVLTPPPKKNETRRHFRPPLPFTTGDPVPSFFSHIMADRFNKVGHGRTRLPLSLGVCFKPDVVIYISPRAQSSDHLTLVVALPCDPPMSLYSTLPASPSWQPPEPAMLTAL